MNIQEYLIGTEDHDEVLNVRPELVFGDGSKLSVQHSSFHFCDPDSCEVSGWSDEDYEGFWYRYSPEIDEPAGWVPFSVVNMFIAIKGGVKDFVE